MNIIANKNLYHEISTFLTEEKEQCREDFLDDQSCQCGRDFRRFGDCICPIFRHLTVPELYI